MAGTAPFFLQQLTDNDGKPLSNGKLYSYVGGSTNLPKTLYYDKELTTPTPNPLIADASGILPQYFLTSGAYKFAVYTSNDVLVATRDWINGSGDATSGSSDDHKVAVDGTDTNPGYLLDKIIGGGAVSVGTVNIPGVGLKTTVTGTGTVKTSNGDSTLNYLENKIIDSPSITWETVGGVNKQLVAKINPIYGTVIPVWCILGAGIDTPPFGLSTDDLNTIHSQHYGVAGEDITNGGSGLAIWYLEGGTTLLDATWVKQNVKDGQMILNANFGLYDYMHQLPEGVQDGINYSNFPAGLYVCQRDSDWSDWIMLHAKQYPDPNYNTDSVLTYNGFTKTFNWTATSAFEGNGTVKVQEADTPRYLEYKVQGGPGITVTNVYNGVYGNFLSISASGSNPSGGQYTSTMYVANATSTLAPNIISRTELICLFVPTTDYTITYNQSLFGMFVSQGGTGNLTFTLRDDQYRLIAASESISNPTPAVFLELVTGFVQDPITQAYLTSYKLNAGDRYYLGISTTANGIQFIGDDAVQNTNIQPYPAYKVDNITGGIIYQLSGGGESKLRPFIRLKG